MPVVLLVKYLFTQEYVQFLVFQPIWGLQIILLKSVFCENLRSDDISCLCSVLLWFGNICMSDSLFKVQSLEAAALCFSLAVENPN